MDLEKKKKSVDKIRVCYSLVNISYLHMYDYSSYDMLFSSEQLLPPFFPLTPAGITISALIIGVKIRKAPENGIVGPHQPVTVVQEHPYIGSAAVLATTVTTTQYPGQYQYPQQQQVQQYPYPQQQYPPPPPTYSP